MYSLGPSGIGFAGSSTGDWAELVLPRESSPIAVVSTKRTTSVSAGFQSLRFMSYPLEGNVFAGSL
jgi:hypothetical protein